MKHLLALFTLLLTVASAQAQSEKITVVTKLPGEETLSIRERAERDFLMPVRRKKVVVEAPKTIGEEVKAVAEEGTAAPETDGATTAHFTEAADEVRSEEAAPAREAHVARTHSVRHSARHSSSRSHKASKSKSSKSHSAKKSSHKAKSKAKSSKKSSSHKKAKKSTSHKSSHKKKHRR